MPKMKSHSGAKERFKITGSGKIVRRRQNHGHKLVKKSAKRKRRLTLPVRLSKEDSLIVSKLLGISINNG
ncbi:MAG TPA: 50S ribosomal protein L35 [Firmicutes bacterium]|nr:50S ribosomal protein L35 [Bacillota bacterium]